MHLFGYILDLIRQIICRQYRVPWYYRGTTVVLPWYYRGTTAAAEVTYFSGYYRGTTAATEVT